MDIEHHDRVAEVYFRQAFSKTAQDTLIKRIGWIYEAVEGDTVFDIGCSQGIVEYLLAAKCRKVIGVDIDSEAISYGRTLLEKLPAEQSKNVQFICDDIYKLQPDDIGKFDTVLMTEVIEHFDDPRRLVLKGIEFCKDGGLLIITTPFGLHRAPDHKVTFYNSRLESCFGKVGDVVSLEITDKYYCIVIRVNTNGEFKLNKSHGLMQEAGFELIENAMQDSIDDLKQSLISSKESVRKAKDNYIEQKNRVLKIQESLGNYKKQNIQLKERLDVASSLQKNMIGKKELESTLKETLSNELQGGLSSYAKHVDLKFNEMAVYLNQVGVLEQELGSLKSESEQLSSVNIGLIAANDRLIKQKDELKQELSVSTKQNDELKRELSASAKQNDEFKRELSDSATQKEAREKELSQIKDEFNSLRDEKKFIVLSKSESVQRYNAIRDAFSYRLGFKIVNAFMRPGLHTLLLPFDLVKLLSGTFRMRKTLEREGETKPGNNHNTFEPATGTETDALQLTEELPIQAIKQKENAGDGSEQNERRYEKTKINKKMKDKVYKHTLANGFSLPEKQGRPIYEVTDTIFYLCHMSMPLMTNGYATRTHHLVKSMKQQGIDLKVYTRLGYPYDLRALNKKAEQFELDKGKRSSYDVDSIEYCLLHHNEFRMDNLILPDYINAYADAIVEQALKYKPKYLHAASDYRNGLSALIAGFRLGIPVHYEMRGLWHITKSSKEPEYRETNEFQFIDYLEKLIIDKADVVYTLTNALTELYTSAGAERSKFKLLPNGVDSSAFNRDAAIDAQGLAEKYDVDGKVVIGYIGSILEYEGLEQLIYAAKSIVQKGICDFKLLIVGDGEYLDTLISLTSKLSMDSFVHFTGRVPHDQVASFYSLIDITPFPRRALPVCELVSPIKPMEAMACQKAIVASSVEALAEMVVDGETGIIFEKDNVEDLTEKLITLIQSPDYRQELGDRAHKWVLSNRDWRKIVNEAIAR